MSDDELPNRWGFLNPGQQDEENKPATSASPAAPQVSPIAERNRALRADPEPAIHHQLRRKKKGFFLRFVFFPGLFFGIIGIIAFFAAAIYFHGKALVFDLSKLKEVPERTLVYDRNGELMGHVAGHGENRLSIEINKVSQNFIRPLLAREDTRFFKHGGVDYMGITRAALRNLKSGSMDQGASTLTMQLARNTFGMTEKSYVRKATEIAIARRIERKYSKEQILEYYVNRVYFGSGLYGIERAAQGYFMKPASELSLGEGAMLAGVIRGPSLLNPFKDPEAAKSVRNETLDRMVAEKTITAAEAQQAKIEPVTLRPPEMRFATGSYVLQQIHEHLTDSLSDDQIKRGGLRVYTTIDSKLQAAAEKGLDEHLTQLEARPGWAHPRRVDFKENDARITDYVQGAVVSLDNRSGAILAYVGGRHFNESPFNRAIHAKRQVGSTFKPFVYAVAFDRGHLLPGTLINDGPIQYNAGNGQIWSPKNYDGTYQGNKPAAWGLIQSRNTMSVRVGNIAGMDNIQALTKAFYIKDVPTSPVAYLGAFETTPMHMTSAFSTLASGGINYKPYMIERIENAEGQTLFQAKERGVRIFRESVAWLTSDVLNKVVTEGTARSAITSMGYNTPACGKTGTTNENKDAWFIGYTDKVTTGVWIGLDKPKEIMYKGTGSALALPVWVNIMKTADQIGYKGEVIPPPAGSQTVYLCRECGKLADRRTTDAEVYQMILPKDLIPSDTCKGHQPVSIFSKAPDWYQQQRGGSGAAQPSGTGPAQPKPSAFKRFLRDIFNF